MRPVGWLLASGVVALCACHAPHAVETAAPLARPAVLTDVSRRQVEAEVRDVLRSLEAAERALDAGAVLSFLAPDFVMVQDGTRVDHADTVAQIRNTLPTLRAFEPHFDEILVFVLDIDTVLTTMIFRDEVTDAGGVTTLTWGPSTMLWQRRAGTWQMVFADSDHYPVHEMAAGDRRLRRKVNGHAAFGLS